MSTKTWRNKDHIHIDRQARTQKQYTLLSLIFAAYQSKESLKQEYGDILNSNTIEDIMNSTSVDSELAVEIKDKYRASVVERLKSSFELFRENVRKSSSGAGTYGAYETGIEDQFDSTYTPGLIYGVFLNRELDLSPNAIKVAKCEITLRQYMDATYLNYLCIVDGEAVHIIYKILKFMKENDLKEISKDIIKEVFKDKIGNSDVNAIIKWMDGGTFFKETNESIFIADEYDLDQILDRCNTEYDEVSLDEIKSNLGTQEKYAMYVTDFNIKEDEEGSANEDKVEKQGRLGSNIIYYGAPGTGKSHMLNEEAKKFGFCERVTFYPEYTHDDFIGCFMPQMSYAKNDNLEYVTFDGKDKELPGKPMPYYTFNPGPFTKALVNALNNPAENILLIIEELNRANAAAVFGNFFQLLDRENGKSKYEISISEEYSEYLSKEASGYSKGDKLYIPGNLSIYATMNSADQGVNPLDAAFKRRWHFKYVPIDLSKSEHKESEILYGGGSVTWEVFATTINDQLKKKGINEDKLLGQYFVDKSEITELEKFSSKILLYLFDDVLKFNRKSFFKPDYRTFSELLDAFKGGKEIFEFEFEMVPKEENENNSEVDSDDGDKSEENTGQAEPTSEN